LKPAVSLHIRTGAHTTPDPVEGLNLYDIPERSKIDIKATVLAGE
jgi:hypothetical protein